MHVLRRSGMSSPYGFEHGIYTGDDKIRAIRDWPRSQVSDFLGICAYYRTFAEGFAKISAHLHQLTEPKTTFSLGNKPIRKHSEC